MRDARVCSPEEMAEQLLAKADEATSGSERMECLVTTVVFALLGVCDQIHDLRYPA